MRASFAAIGCSAVLAMSAAAGALAAPARAAEDTEAVVVWGGQEHRQPATLEAWLRSRGASYELWAERHPAAAARLEGSGAALPPPEPAPRAVPRSQASPTPVAPAAPPPVAEAAWSTAGSIAMAMLGLGIALLVLAALVASPLIHAVPWSRQAQKLREGAMGLALAGVVIVVSVGVGYAL